MNASEFLQRLQKHCADFSKAVATSEGDWIVKGFIDVHKNIYTVSVDTKIVSKVLELLLFPMFVSFAQENGLILSFVRNRTFIPT